MELSGCLWDFEIPQGKYARSEKAFVPGCWETMPGLGNYRGTAVYRRRFRAGGNIRLEFKGVSHTTQVHVDQQLVKEHYGEYTPFAVVLTDLADGEHTLEVVVNNQFVEEAALHKPNDYMTYGGINRPVVLENLGTAYIKWAHYTPYHEADGWHLSAEVCVEMLEKPTVLSAEVQVNGHTVALHGEPSGNDSELLFRGSAPIENVQVWDIENPRLYSITSLLKSGDSVIDDLIDRIGFREVTLRENRICLNGKPVRIKGVCRHEDYAGFGCAIPVQAMQKDLQIIKDLGCNAIRTTHYPNDELFLDLCDEQGILVWEESHARGFDEKIMRRPNFDWQSAQCIEEMIQAHYNHPAIYIWGILNECASETEYGRSCYARQLAQIRALDASRPRTFATCRFLHDPDGSNFRLTDICLDLPDVVSFNIYPQWYFNADVQTFLRSVRERVDETAGKGKPFLISEIGAGGEYGFHSAEHLKWSEEYQADALAEQLQGVLSDEQCSGVYIWQYCDTRVSNEWFARRPRTSNNKGVVDGYRRPKMAYDTVERIFHAYSNYFERELN